MKRRDFIKGTLGSLLLGSQAGCAQSFVQPSDDALLRLNPSIQPAEREEKREYDRSRPDLVVWHTAPRGKNLWWDPNLKTINGDPTKDVLRTVGFVEALADSTKILYIPGLLILPFSQFLNHSMGTPHPGIPGGGFYFWFRISFYWLSLPRRSSKAPGVIQERYAFPDEFSLSPDVGFPKHFASFDMREIKLIEYGKIYKPSHMQYLPVSDDEVHANFSQSWIPAGKIEFPSQDTKNVLSGFQAYTYFDIPPRPIRFKLEFPPLVLQGIEIPLPVCYCEPFDLRRDKWVE